MVSCSEGADQSRVVRLHHLLRRNEGLGPIGVQETMKCERLCDVMCLYRVCHRPTADISRRIIMPYMRKGRDKMTDELE